MPSGAPTTNRAPHQPRGHRIGLLLCVSALLACGPKTWSQREVTVPTRTLSVDERELFASAGGEGRCTSTVTLVVAKSCEKRCGPIDVSRGSERFATLLGPSRPEVEPIPDELRPAYAKEARDESRVRVAIPLNRGETTLGLSSDCGAVFRTRGGSLVVDGARLTAGSDTAAACESLDVEVDCS